MSTRQSIKYERSEEGNGDGFHLYADLVDDGISPPVYLELIGTEFTAESWDGGMSVTVVIPRDWAIKLGLIEEEPTTEAAKQYAADNPLGGPARMFDAIAERIRSGEEYYAVLKDYGVTVEGKHDT